MKLKPATIIAIIGLSVAFLMQLLPYLNVFLPAPEQGRPYWVAQGVLLYLPLINFLVSLYIKQKK
jgi:hypothetical protein